MTVLSKVLRELPSPLELEDKILQLPIAHLTTLHSFERIVNNGGDLKPLKCDVFDCELLYFSYGGVFHRPKQFVTNKPFWLPVAILFTPKLLNQMNCFFPYDTGAAKKNFYGRWSSELSIFEKYRIPNGEENNEILQKLVHYTYGSNEQYLAGNALENTAGDEPLLTLINFLKADLSQDNTENNTDHRQHVIECQTSQVISLKNVFEDIIWIGLPAQCREQFNKLCQLTRPIRPPTCYFYPTSKNENPYAIARELQGKARDEIIQPRYLDFF